MVWFSWQFQAHAAHVFDHVIFLDSELSELLHAALIIASHVADFAEL